MKKIKLDDSVYRELVKIKRILKTYSEASADKKLREEFARLAAAADRILNRFTGDIPPSTD